MRYIQEIFSNRVLWIGILSWFTAQTLKIIFRGVIEKEWDFTRFFAGQGGMPSSHSAVVASMATSVGIACGFYSVEFAISALMAIVVMTDAAGVRRAAGKQAAVLNKIVQDMIVNGKGITNERLKELLGHSPFEVLVGALLGILLAFICM